MESAQELLLKALGEIAAKGKIFKVNALTKFSAKLKNNSFRSVPIAEGKEFVLMRVREGKRSDFIFELEPFEEDPQYVSIDVESKKLGVGFEDLESHLTDELAQVLGVTGSYSNSFSRMVTRFIKEKTEELERLAKEIEEKREKDLADSNAEDPLWGTW